MSWRSLLWATAIAFSRQLQIVRKQLAQVDSELIRTFSGSDPEAAPGTRLIGLSADEKVLIVQMDDHLVLLPGLVDDEGLYERISEAAAGKSKTRQFSYKSISPIPWPKGPALSLDRHILKNRSAAPGVG